MTRQWIAHASKIEVEEHYNRFIVSRQYREALEAHSFQSKLEIGNSESGEILVTYNLLGHIGKGKYFKQYVTALTYSSLFILFVWFLSHINPFREIQFLFLFALSIPTLLIINNMYSIDSKLRHDLEPIRSLLNSFWDEYPDKEVAEPILIETKPILPRFQRQTRILLYIIIAFDFLIISSSKIGHSNVVVSVSQFTCFVAIAMVVGVFVSTSMNKSAHFTHWYKFRMLVGSALIPISVMFIGFMFSLPQLMFKELDSPNPIFVFTIYVLVGLSYLLWINSALQVYRAYTLLSLDAIRRGVYNRILKSNLKVTGMTTTTKTSLIQTTLLYSIFSLSGWICFILSLYILYTRPFKLLSIPNYVVVVISITYIGNSIKQLYVLHIIYERTRASRNSKTIPETVRNSFSKISTRLNVSNINLCWTNNKNISAHIIEPIFYGLPKLLVISNGAFIALNEQELESLIAHELAHINLGHTASAILRWLSVFTWFGANALTVMTDYYWQEIQADKLAIATVGNKESMHTLLEKVKSMTELHALRLPDSFTLWDELRPIESLIQELYNIDMINQLPYYYLLAMIFLESLELNKSNRLPYYLYPTIDDRIAFLEYIEP